MEDTTGSVATGTAAKTYTDEEVAEFATGLGITTEAVYQALSELTDPEQLEHWTSWWEKNDMPSTTIEFIAARLVFPSPKEFAEYLIKERNLFQADQLLAKVVISLSALTAGIINNAEIVEAA
jgi:hypothetical protein